MQKLKLFDTKARTAIEFNPINDKEVTLYSCGPTVYAVPHIGNMRAYVFSALLRQALESNGYRVKSVLNITDVGHLTSDMDEGDDKMQKASKREGCNAWSVAQKYTSIFMRYLNMLKIPAATHFPRATDYIDEQINFVSELEEKGYTYRTCDGIYFDTSKFERYTEFAKLDVEGLNQGARVDASEKRNKTDFALWKFSPKNEQRDMEWNSPWGIGFPGWHIECSAMAMALLGEQIDIHTGGIDHIPVHHTNEVCQSESLTGKPFANFWMHINFLQIEPIVGSQQSHDELKMSKSKGNVITLDTIVDKGYSPMALKYMYYSAHYRNQMKFNYQLLDSAQRSLQGLYDKSYAVLQTANTGSQSDVLVKIRNAINNDLNSPLALSILHQGLSDNTLSAEQKYSLIEYAESIFQIGILEYSPEATIIPDDIKALAEQRSQARKEKNWALSDSIRNEMTEKGYTIKDGQADTFEVIRHCD